MAPQRMQSHYGYCPRAPTSPNVCFGSDHATIPHGGQQSNDWRQNAAKSYYPPYESDLSDRRHLPFTLETYPSDNPYSPHSKAVEQNASSRPGDYTWINSFHQPSPYRDTSPWQSPDSSTSGDTCSAVWSSSSHSPEPHRRSLSNHGANWSHSVIGIEPCVSMSDVQHQPDVEPNYFPPSYPEAPYGQYSGLWYHEQQSAADTPMEYPSMPADYSSTQMIPHEVAQHVCQPRSPPVSPPGLKKRKQKRQPQRSMPVSTSNIRENPLEFKPQASRRQTRQSSKTASFPCPLAKYGCASSFLSKNEWKRHINTQHLRLEAWQCDQCPQRDGRPNNFNRKDLFIQHLRRMHYPDSDAKTGQNKANQAGDRTAGAKSNRSEETEASLVAAERRCHQILGDPPAQSACLFCPLEFFGDGSWDERTEHIARHMEADKKEGRAVPQPASWKPDVALEEWMITKGVIAHAKRGWKIAA